MHSRNIFNFMALALQKLQIGTDSKLYEKYPALSSSKSSGINELLEKYFPELFHDNMIEEIPSRYLKDRALVQRLYEFSEKCANDCNFEYIVRLLGKLDLCMSKWLVRYRASSAEAVLNDNVTESGIQILPRCSCSWAHQSRDRNTSYSMNNYLKYCYYVPIDRLRGYTIHHVLLSTSLRLAKAEGTLKVGITPLIGNAMLKCSFYEKEGENNFSVVEISEKERREEYALRQLKTAIAEGVDLLCYPEMLGSQDMIGILRRRLERFPNGNEKYPLLTICPTVWIDHANTCVVLDETGMEVIRQEKLHSFPYEYKGKIYREDIRPDPVIQLIHCEGIGRIAVLICKDAITREYLQMILEILKVTLIIVPAFSTGHYDFEELLQICRTYDCCAVWVNSCSVQMLDADKKDNLDTIGFVLRTGIKSKLRNGNYPFCRSEECRTEGTQKDCGNCLYIKTLLFQSEQS